MTKFERLYAIIEDYVLRGEYKLWSGLREAAWLEPITYEEFLEERKNYGEGRNRT